jgi:hypothetical protein
MSKPVQVGFRQAENVDTVFLETAEDFLECKEVLSRTDTIDVDEVDAAQFGELFEHRIPEDLITVGAALDHLDVVLPEFGANR